MEPILWIAFYMTVWTALAIWSAIEARGIGSPFGPEWKAPRTLAPTRAALHGAPARQV